jgi:hypothetical protein
MTLRVWVSEIESVIFGKDSPRQVVRMRGLQAKADELATTLKQFGESKSMIIAPTTRTDMDRAQAIGQISALIDDPSKSTSTSQATINQQVAAATLTNQPSASTLSHCKSCHAEVESNSKFCMECGIAIAV